MKRFFLSVFLLMVVLLVAAVSAEAQSTGTVKGVVKDSTGAILPGASVTLTNKGTQQTVQTQTTEAGTYTFSFLQPADYSLTTEMPGFKKSTQDNITVNVAQVLEIDSILQVGEVTSEITVTGAIPMVQTESAELGEVVDNIMVTNIPLSSRNFTQILGMQAGVESDVPNAGNIGRNSVNISANGARPFENSMTFNGLVADNIVSQGFDDASDKPGVPIPAPDAIQVFKVQTGLYDAEYGRQGGANVNVVTKSGGNEIHGTMFEFFRNNALNANSFFNNTTGTPRSILKQNQYGATLGGPIEKDHLFWFFSYQGTKQSNGVSSSSDISVNIPQMGNRTAAALGALYAGQRGLLSGGQGVAIAPDGSNINPVAIALLNARINGAYAIPTPQIIQANGTGFSTFSVPAQFTENQAVLDLDQVTGSGEHRAIRLFWALLPQELPFSNGNVPGYTETDKRLNLNVSITDTRPFTPRLVNDLRFGYNRLFVKQVPTEPITAAQLGLTPAVAEFAGMPAISVSGLFSIGPASNNDQTMLIHNPEVADTLSITKGKHDIRVGGNVAPHQVNWYDAYLSRGSISFSSFPDFLLGESGAQNGTGVSNVNSASTNNGIFRSHPRFTDFSAFVQDDYRTTQRLTLNLGMRYQYNGWQWDARGRDAGFDPAIANYGDIPAGGTYAGFEIPDNANVTVPAGFTVLNRKTMVAKENWLGFSPRVGFAYRPIAGDNEFVIRGGYGLYWSPVGGTVTMQGWFDPWAILFSSGGTAGPNSTFQAPFTPAPPPSSAFPVFIPIGSAPTRSTEYINPDMKEEYTQSWSLNTQHGLGDGFMLEAGYVGSKGTHIDAGFNRNQALLASPGAPIHEQTTNTLANVNQRVPILGFTPKALDEMDNNFDSEYESAQLSLRKQYSNRMTFQVAYTISHSIDDVSAAESGRNQPIGSYTGDIYNHRGNRGSSAFDRRQRFVTSYLYDIPGLNQNPLLRSLSNGWGFSGTAIIQSGTPFSVSDGTAATIYGTSGYAQFASGMGASNAKLTGSTESRLNAYFNTAAFAPPPVIGNGTGFGNAGRSILVGPGQANFDMALKRSFKTKDKGNVEFRSEFFNIFNHPVFGNPGASRSSASSFGHIQSTVVSPRIIQFALKYAF